MNKQEYARVKGHPCTLQSTQDGSLRYRWNIDGVEYVDEFRVDGTDLARRRALYIVNKHPCRTTDIVAALMVSAAENGRPWRNGHPDLSYLESNCADLIDYTPEENQ